MLEIAWRLWHAGRLSRMILDGRLVLRFRARRVCLNLSALSTRMLA